MYIEYADLLCDMGKEEDAKAIYYVALRKVDWSAEPFPLLIVFDYDPGMEVWNYTKETFKAATCMVHIATCESSNVKLIASLKQLAPSWSAPRVYESYGDGKRGLPSLTEAYSKATTPEQRGWIQEFIDLNKATVDDYAAARDAIVKQHSQIGQERRAASAVLRQAKLDLATKFRHLARDASEVRLKQ